MKTKIKWGLLGYGKFGKKIEQVFYKSKYSQLSCIASKSFANKDLKIQKDKIIFFDRYEDLINDKKIENIYIATTNNLHKDLIILAANNKKNIICEKPACMNVEDFNECIDVIKKNNVFFMEGLMYLHHPQINKAIEIIKSNQIGKITKIISNFGYKVGKKFLFFELKKIDTRSRLFNSKLGGGAIFDLSCYPLTAALLFFKLINKENKIVNSKFYRQDGRYGVDENAKAILNFECGGVAELGVSIRKNLDNIIEVIGTKGKIRIPFPWIAPPETFIEINEKNINNTFKIFFKEDIYTLEIDNASMAINSNLKELQFPKINIERSLEYIKVMENWKSTNSKNFF